MPDAKFVFVTLRKATASSVDKLVRCVRSCVLCKAQRVQELSLHDEKHTASHALSLEGLTAALRGVECDLLVEEQLYVLTKTLTAEEVAASNAEAKRTRSSSTYQRRHPVYNVDVSHHTIGCCAV